MKPAFIAVISLAFCLIPAAVNSQCTNGDLRVQDGPVDGEGRAEICKNGVYYQICDDGWSQNDAKVFCRKLGYSTYSAQAYGLSKYGSAGISIDSMNYQCAGTEANLGACTSTSSSNCGTANIAGVKCEPKGPCEADGHTTCCTSGCNAGGCYCDTACYGFGDCCSDIDNTCPQGDPVLACTTNEVRLIDGFKTTGYDGRVEFCLAGQWTTICNDDNSWSSLDASVACKQLGKTSAPTVYAGPSPYGQGYNGITVKSFGCSGTETTLSSCTYTSTGVDCGHQFDVGVDCDGACVSGTVLITGVTNSSMEGHVLYCSSGSYSYISDNGWGLNEAKVVCSQLGHSDSNLNAYGGSQYGSAKVAPTVTVDCDGDESGLSGCTVGSTSSVGVDNAASIKCNTKTICENAGHSGCCTSGCNTGSCYCDSSCHFFQDCCDEIEVTCPNTGSCTEGEVRLVDGPSEYEGRVELCNGGKFGPVCDNSWDDNEAKVVCGQLGYTTADATATVGSYFPEDNRTAVGGGYLCLGGESSLESCTQDESPSCGHHNEAGVRCVQSCNMTGSVRLVGGDDVYEGRVEICQDGVWQTVCQGSLWSQEDAQVVCRQLGHSVAAVIAYGNAFYGEGVGQIAATNIACVGTEDNLYECDNTTSNTCDHSTDVGVDCTGPIGPCQNAGFTTCCTSGCNQGGCYCDSACYIFNDCCSDIALTCPQSTPTSCTDNDVRISGGDNANKGVVEYCIDGAWTSICDDGWGTEEAQVVCNQKGYNTDGAIPVVGSYFGQDIGGPIKSAFTCTGSESTLSACTKADSTCSQHKTAGVVCPETCTTAGAIRLVGGTDETSGYVEVCNSGSWSAVCDDGWCEKDAQVVCGQLGYSTNRAEAYGLSYFGQDLAPIQFTNVNCDGDEATLLGCSKSTNVPSTCNSQSLAGVQCFEKSLCETNGGFTGCCVSGCNQGGCYCDQACHGFGDCCDNIDNTCPTTSSCTNGLIRLVDGTDKFEGRLEYCVDGKWGTVCDDGFGDIDAQKACKQMGLPFQNVHVQGGGYLGQGTSPVVASGILCSAEDDEFKDCAVAPDFCCGHHQDVAIRCSPSCDDGELKLDYGGTSLQGLVKICIDGEFKTVCDDQWSNNDASVICRMLDLSALDAHAYGQSLFNNASNSVAALTGVVCDGTETNWQQCQYSENAQCGVTEFAGVRCEGTVGACEAAGHTSCCTFGCNAGGCYCDQVCHTFNDCCDDIQKICPNLEECTEGEVRIVNNLGKEEFGGRVEVCINGQWGAICDDGWGLNEAHVVCSQFEGYTDYGSVPALGAAFGQSQFQIVGSNFSCTGSEDSIYDCSYSPSPDCGHHQDAGVYCNVKCSEGEIRLINATVEYEGRIEVCNNGTWHPVCDEKWSTEDAQVVCRNMGFSVIGAQAYGNSYFGNGFTPALFNGYNCTGSETNLTDCMTIPVTMCDAASTAGVTCSGEISQCEAAGHTGCCVSGCNAGGCWCDAVCHGFGDCCDGIDSTCPQSTCTNGDVRLMDGSSDYRGRVETCVNGQWGTVCDNGWDDTDARVVCNQLGYPVLGAAGKSGAYFGQGDGNIVASDFQCDGTEDLLTSCTNDSTPSCGHHEDVGVICPEPCSNLGEIRLADGPSLYEGRIEQCQNFQWASVCADNVFCDKSTSVLCKQLGYSPTNSEAYGLARYGEGGGLVGIEALNCLGTEANITDCQFSTESTCSHSTDAGVKCKPLSPCELAGHTSCCESSCYVSQHFCYCDNFCHLFNDCCDNIEATCPGLTICSDGDKKLEKGNDTAGILYVCHESQWKTVCDLSFGDEEAKISCRAQGLDVKDYNVVDVTYYGQGEGQVFSRDTQCTGDEDSVTDCTGNENCCSHNRDVGLICQYACEDGDIRLVGGDNADEGRVEVCFNGRWGTVCDDFWGIEEARVACKMAGKPWRGATATTFASFGQGVGPIHLDNVFCEGTEGTLFNCTHILTNHNCQHYEDAGAVCASGPCELAGYTDGCCDSTQSDCQGVHDTDVCHCDTECELHGDCCIDFDLSCTCTENDIRLVNGANDREGRIEICLNGEFGTVCDDLFGIPDGEVACRQLGYSDAAVTVFTYSFWTGSYFGAGSGPIWLDNLGCTGNESYLTNCSSNGVGIHNCAHFEDAGVRCSDRICTHGEARLVDGDHQYAGRLEVCVNGQWGTVCDDFFGDVDAKVACSQLNLPNEYATWFRSQSLFPAADPQLPIHLDNVGCTGTESSLLDCNYVQHNCFHWEDVAVVCNPPCTDGEIRLVGGDSETNGRLEVCHNQEWGTVCDDFFDIDDAKVACRQLGLPFGSARALLSLQFGQGYGDIQYSQIACTGNESKLADCSKLTTGFFCFHSEDVAISCEDTCQDGQLKLVGSKDPSEGRVEVCRGGYWGTICDNAGTFGIYEARIVCNQLGLPFTAAQVQSFGPGGDPIHYSNLDCIGNELNIGSCSKTLEGFTCTHSQDVGVTCQERCENFEVRLVDGDDPSNGRFEVCIGGVWGTVCDNEFHAADAKVACKQLGFEYEGAEALIGAFGTGEDSIAISALHCLGDEDSFDQCFFSTDVGAVSECTGSQANHAGVVCQGLCNDGDIRLRDGTGAVGDAPPGNGRVEVCFNGKWGTVCDNGWNTADGQVTCGQLGFKNDETLVRSFGSFKYGQGFENIYMTNVLCTGSESCLVTCPHSTDVSDCTHADDAGLRCDGAYDPSTASADDSCLKSCQLPAPSAVTNITINVNPTAQTAEIRWMEPASTNGIITGYIFEVQGFANLNRNIVGDSARYIMLTNLASGVPYMYSLKAKNLCGDGPAVTGVFFTGELVPLAPSIDRVVRTGGESMQATWTALTLAQARGQLQNYELSWKPVSSTDSWSTPVTLPATTTSYNIDSRDLIVSSSYYVRLRARTSVGYGDYSANYLVNTTDSVIIQVKLFLQSTQTCGTWLETGSSDSRLSDMTSEVSNQVNAACTCPFTDEYLVGSFACNPNDAGAVHFRADLYGLDQSTTPGDLSRYVVDWVANDPNVVINGVSFDVDETCDVVITSKDASFCPTRSSSAISGGAIGGAVVGVIIAILVLAGLMIFVIVLVIRVRRPGKYGHGDASNEMVGFSNQMAFPDGTDDNISQRASSTIHEDDFQQAINMISSEVDQDVEKKNLADALYEPSGITFSGDN